MSKVTYCQISTSSKWIYIQFPTFKYINNEQHFWKKKLLEISSLFDILWNRMTVIPMFIYKSNVTYNSCGRAWNKIFWLKFRLPLPTPVSDTANVVQLGGLYSCSFDLKKIPPCLRLYDDVGVKEFPFPPPVSWVRPCPLDVWPFFPGAHIRGYFYTCTLRVRAFRINAVITTRYIIILLSSYNYTQAPVLCGHPSYRCIVTILAVNNAVVGRIISNRQSC